MHFHFISLFPNLIEVYSNSSVLGRAKSKKIIKTSFYNPFDFKKKKLARIDARPYGGGPGMVMEAEPILKAHKKALGKKKNTKTIFFSTGGKQLTNKDINRYKKYKHIIMICGHYEGVDDRVVSATRAECVSVGDVTLTGGEAPAMFLMDCISRELDGVLGNIDSREHTRVSSRAVYTRPEVLLWAKKKYRVPKVLLSGNHKEIDEWRKNS